ncbi:tRNA uridine(34) 5-carboxymethylaminomethyl modification radical SAM/GNAT enzyme Elp3 [Candidatus Woesearchaeota archaeon]|nr:tRNA uridine(34) 5-carboxymethylaminomethyl modification radical SAM/GNAT enzyme Elp3 [Candidatus Woesearchaeota archaeon]
MGKKEFFQELIEELKKRKIDKDEMAKLKVKLCKKHDVKNIPTDIEVMLNASPSDIDKMGLMSKPTRTISGVSVIAVMSRPQECPHAKEEGPCIMCPGGPSSIHGDMPQSYTGKEPATRRGLRNKFDAYFQVMNRLEHYIVQGHMPDKVELIIMGGTFPSFSKKYQEEFVIYAFKALNDFSSMFFSDGKFDLLKFRKYYCLPGKVDDKEREKKVFKNFKASRGKSTLKKEHERNERSSIKCVGLTIETRPDYGMKEHGDGLLRLGCTRVEIGVQSVYDKALKKIKRGHDIKDSIKSIRELKDLGFKINAHYMLGLPGTTEEGDKDGLKRLFSDPDFRPDMLKIYPCMVVKGTGLYDLWKKGKYDAMATEKAASIIAEFKKDVPSWVRIMRVQRDIPTYMTEAGVDRTNLRQYVMEHMKEKGWKCNCIRCREIGRAVKKLGKVKIGWKHYKASKEHEFFISAEDKDHLYGFCRMRFPSENLRKEISEDSVLIRELHVYGPAVQIGKTGAVQHKGIGKRLLEKAEEIAKTYYKKKVVVISGVGVRGYYRKIGYRKEGPYMVKKL